MRACVHEPRKPARARLHQPVGAVSPTSFPARVCNPMMQRALQYGMWMSGLSNRSRAASQPGSQQPLVHSISAYGCLQRADRRSYYQSAENAKTAEE